MRNMILLGFLFFAWPAYAEDKPNPYFERGVRNFSTSELEWRTKEAHELINELSDLGQTRELTEAEQDAKFWAFQASKAYAAILLERELCSGKQLARLEPEHLTGEEVAKAACCASPSSGR